MENTIYLFCTGNYNVPEFYTETIYLTFEEAKESFIEYMIMTEPDDDASWCRIDQTKVEKSYYELLINNSITSVNHEKVLSRMQFENYYADYSNFRDILKKMGIYEMYYEEVDEQYDQTNMIEL